MAKASPFRQAALDRLSSPEQLDQLFEVTRPNTWIALIALWLLIGVALAWSIFGRIPVTIDGTGILLSEAGVREVETQGAGVVQTLAVHEGDLIEPGTLIARISQPKLEQDVRQSTDRLTLLRTERTAQQSYLNTNTTLETQRLNAERTDVERRLAALRERTAYLEGRVKAEREARALGLVTETSVQNSVQQLEGARGELAGLEMETQRNTLSRLLLDNRNTESLGQIDDRIREAERELAARELLLKQASSVVSPYHGYIREIRTNIGQLTTAGQAIVSIELAGVPVHALVFVSSEGKLIEKGMDARISPVTVRQEEYGYMLGTVRSVSTQPVTLAGMTRTLGNDILVQQIASRGATYLVEVSLMTDTTTFSRLKWSSRAGPPIHVGSGTSVQVSMVVSRRRPITLLLPMFRSILGMAA